MTEVPERSNQSGFELRHGWSPLRRLREPDSYGVLLLAIAGVFVVIPATSEAGIEGIVTGLVLTGTVGFALWTSRASGRWFAVVSILVVALFVIELPLGLQPSVVRAARSSLALVIVLIVIGSVIRRVQAHLVVSGATMAAALCLYLLIGLAFAALYGLLAALGDSGLFRQVGDGTSLDRLYFSLLTLTTVGYGDLTPAGAVARMVAVSEALLGQLYLVSVVALVVGNIGRERRPRPSRPSST